MLEAQLEGLYILRFARSCRCRLMTRLQVMYSKGTRGITALIGHFVYACQPITRLFSQHGSLFALALETWCMRKGSIGSLCVNTQSIFQSLLYRNYLVTSARLQLQCWPTQLMYKGALPVRSHVRPPTDKYGLQTIYKESDTRHRNVARNYGITCPSMCYYGFMYITTELDHISTNICNRNFLESWLKPNICKSGSIPGPYKVFFFWTWRSTIIDF